MTDSFGPDLADESPGALRTEAPKLLEPLDENSPVSGHRPPADHRVPGAEAPEHDWSAAKGRVFPLLRAADTEGIDAAALPDLSLADSPANTLPIARPGPLGLTVVYGLAAEGFAVLVNPEHMLTWGISGDELDAAAVANLAAWSSEAEWVEERTDARRLLSSSTCDGYDASRILLEDVRARIGALAVDAPAGTRVLVGLPDRDLLVAAPLVPGDEEFGALFGEFVAEQYAGGSMPIAEQVLELRGGELVAFDA
jgi:hypothetical protein